MAASTQRHGLLRKRLARFSRLLPGVEQGDVTALHRTRVASRRLRELLPILQLEHETARKLSRRLRNVTSRLGTVRELDVLLILIDELHESRRYNASALKRVADQVAPERARAREKLLQKKMPIAELKQLARKLDRIVEAMEARSTRASAGHPARGWQWALDARIAHRAASLREALRDAGAVYLPDRLHTVRIAVKKLRYALELSVEASGTGVTPELRALKRAQELLGRLNDLHMLTNRVRQIQASLTPPNAGVWRELDELTAALENSCRRLHARYMGGRTALAAVAGQLARRAGVRSARTASRAVPRRAAI
ncbi:MAG: CHAD domain-containing protein [Acidobacteria bacterium]|nr:CHAD domain-containing protein [Acidobacteriota bacterium]